MTLIYINNPHSTDTINYRGQDILPGEYFLIPSNRLTSWQVDSNLLTDIANGVAIVAIDNTGNGDISDVNEAIDLLKGNQIRKVENIAVNDPNGKRARLIGIAKDTAAVNTDTKADWLIPQLQFPAGTDVTSIFDGVQYYARDANHGDTITFQVVDKDGTGVTLGLYSQAAYDAYKDSEGVFVVEQFGDPWYVAPNYLEDIILYKAILVPGLHIRVIYTNVDANNAVNFFVNLFRHIEA
jgi:hypothetical protein